MRKERKEKLKGHKACFEATSEKGMKFLKKRTRKATVPSPFRLLFI